MDGMIECFNENGAHRAVCIDTDSRYYGWVFYRRADGQWVTLREATPDEMHRANLASMSSLEHYR